MQDRINIDGVWYVREKKSTAMAAPPKEVDPNDYEWEVIPYKAIEVNYYKQGWKLSAEVLEADGKVSMPSIELSRRPLGEKHWESDDIFDNDQWLNEVADRDESAMYDLQEYDKDLQAAIIYLCDQMKKREWI